MRLPAQGRACLVGFDRFRFEVDGDAVYRAVVAIIIGTVFRRHVYQEHGVSGVVVRQVWFGDGSGCGGQSFEDSVVVVSCGLSRISLSRCGFQNRTCSV